jgi:phosphoglycerate-specific signal transduction histidine kinase
MDEDDFKEPSTALPDFEHLVPKSFVSSERNIKNRAIKALDKIEKLIMTIDTDEKKELVVVLNQYSKILADIANVIKEVDIHGKE